MAIVLIRHGETESNLTRVVQTPETPLNARGVGQAALLAQRLGEEDPIVEILVSPLRRAEMTAEPLGTRLTLDPQREEALQERNFGDHRGQRYRSLGIDIMAADHHPPGGESWEEFHRRVDGVWPRIKARAAKLEGDLAVVTHGLVCYSLALRHLVLPEGEEVPTRWGNTSVTRIESSGSSWRVTLLNCTRHLKGEFLDRTAVSGI